MSSGSTLNYLHTKDKCFNVFLSGQLEETTDGQQNDSEHKQVRLLEPFNSKGDASLYDDFAITIHNKTIIQHRWKKT